MEYATLQPFGESAAWYRNAMLMSLHANMNRDPKKRSEPYTPDDFLPYGQKKKALPAKFLADGLKAAFAGRIKEKKKDG